MAALVRSLLHVGPAKLLVSALALSVACATVEETEGGGGPGPSRGGSMSGGSGGALAGGTATAGTPPTSAGGSVPGSSGTGAGTTAGAPSTSGGAGAATGGAPATTGGAPTTTGGTPTTTGGASSGTCPQYSGALAADSLIFMGGFGKATTGTWSGYGYTYKYGPATVTPGTGTACFVGAKFCANGTVPASDEAGAGLGWNISQMMGASTMAKVPITTPVKLSFAGVSAGMRVQLSASATVSYCYTLTATDLTTPGTVTIPHTSFKTECWGTAGTAYDGIVPIEAIQIAVPGSAAGTTQAFDICVKDIEPG